MSEIISASRVDSPSDHEGSGAEQPILPGFYSDPTICRVGEDYYLATSSFEYFPGAPIWHSQDLVTWRQIGHVLTRRSQFRLGSARPSTGVYGSTLRHHHGRFWFVTTNVSDFTSGQVLVHAADPAGPWSEPILIPQARGIDPDLVWDGDDCFLTWKALDFGRGEGGILQATLDTGTGELGPITELWGGSGLQAAEGPHLYEIDNVWYLLLAEGGTERGHAVTVARGPRPSGPFEPCPWNPVLSHRSSDHVVQNTGHADLVQTPTGEWAAVYLGARPKGSTPGFHVLGRETFLAGVNWVEGWPLFDERRFDVPATATAFSDDFAGKTLHDRWVVPGGEPAAIVERLPAGGIAVHPLPNGEVGLLCARVRDHYWLAEATVTDTATFKLRIDDRHWYAMQLQNGVLQVEARIGDLRAVVAQRAVQAGHVTLRITCLPPDDRPVPLGAAGPDVIVLGTADEDGYSELARLDGRYLSTEVASGFTGRMLALASESTQIHAVSYRPLDADARR